MVILGGRGTLGWSALTKEVVSCFLGRNDPKIRLHHFPEGLDEPFWKYSRFLWEHTRNRKLNMSALGRIHIFELTTLLLSAKKTTKMHFIHILQLLICELEELRKFILYIFYKYRCSLKSNSKVWNMKVWMYI